MSYKKQIIGICIVLNLLLLAIAPSAQSNVQLEGRLEVLHADDLENPENSKFLFYLNVGGERYQIKYDKQLPVMVSGTEVKASGTVLNNTLLLSDLSLKDGTQVIVGNKTEPDKVIVEKEIDLKSSINWIYWLGLALALVVASIAYFMRKGSNSKRAQQRSASVTELRGYVVTNLRRGYTREQIKNTLVRNNYNKDEIDEAFRGL